MTKVAVVTGANKGLGFYLVKGLCEKFNGVVYLTSRNSQRGIEACKKLQTFNLSPKFYELDITDTKSISNFITHLKSEHEKIDVLINNAGVLFLKDSKETKIYQAECTLSVNFYSLINFTESMLPLIKEHGTILNISSSSGHLSRIPSYCIRQRISAADITLESLKVLMKEYMESVKNDTDVEMWGSSPYVISKVAVNAYTFMLNRRLKSKCIPVNCVHPGYVMSDMTNGAGSISPEEGAMVPLQLVLNPQDGGLYVWHNGTQVPWDGPDPRGYIDKINLSKYFSIFTL